MPGLVASLRIEQIQHAGPSKVDFGATVTGVDLNQLSEDEFRQIEEALYVHKVLVFPNQHSLDPDRQFALVQAFDPTAPSEHGHNDATASHKGQKSLLHGIGNSIGLHPEVKLIGGGVQPARFDGITLTQADHVAYHRFPLDEATRKAGFTRWHRWHMDAALYKTSLPLITTLFAVNVPKGELTVRWDDESGNEMKVQAGSTGFVSGKRMFESVPAEKRKFVEHSRVMYAPHPYQWNGGSKGNSNGLGTYNEGKEMAFEDLPEWKEDDLKVYPMTWTCPKTGDRSFQVHSVAVWKLLLKDSPDGPETVVDDLAEVRKWLYEAQRPVLEPENIWAPAYEPGMMVMFYNRGVYHSATDYWHEMGSRSMLQAHVASSFDPK